MGSLLLGRRLVPSRRETWGLGYFAVSLVLTRRLSVQMISVTFLPGGPVDPPAAVFASGQTVRRRKGIVRAVLRESTLGCFVLT